MRSQYRPFIVFSSDRHDLSQGDNTQNYVEALYQLESNGIGYRRLKGVYKGQEGRSFMLELNDKNLSFAKDMAGKFNQECILVMDNEGRGILDYGDKQENIGFLQVSNTRPTGDHSKVLDSQQYFTFA